MNQDNYIIYGIFIGMIVFLLFVFGNTVSANNEVNYKTYITEDSYITDYSSWFTYNYGGSEYIYVRSYSLPLNARGLLNATGIPTLLNLCGGKSDAIYGVMKE